MLWLPVQAVIENPLQQRFVRHARALCRLREILTVGDLGVGVGFQHIEMPVLG